MFNGVNPFLLVDHSKIYPLLSVGHNHCSLFKQHANKCTYIDSNNLKFTLKHLKRSYMFRSYDHPVTLGRNKVCSPRMTQDRNMQERFKCFNVNFWLLKTIYVHLLVCYLNYKMHGATTKRIILSQMGAWLVTSLQRL